MARTWRGSGGGRGRGRGRGRGGRHAGGRNGNNGNDIDAAGGHSTRSPRVLHGPTPHPWLGRRLRITRISHKGQRRYVNAVIVFHDPAESHPFHVLHDDGAHAWLAIQESQGVVHAVEGDSGGTTVGVRRKRISRKFMWLTQVVRRETVSNERGGAGGAPHVNGSHGNPNANSNALPAHPAPAPPNPTTSMFFNPNVPPLGASTGRFIRKPVSGMYGFPPSPLPSLMFDPHRRGSFGMNLNVQSSMQADLARRASFSSFPGGASGVPLSPLGQLLAGHPVHATRVSNTTNAHAVHATHDSPIRTLNTHGGFPKASPWDGILEEFGTEAEDVSGDGGNADLRSLEAAARVIGAAAANNTPTTSSLNAHTDTHSYAQQSLDGMDKSVLQTLVDDSIALLKPAALALCVSAARERRYPPNRRKEIKTSTLGTVPTTLTLKTDTPSDCLPLRVACAGCSISLAGAFAWRACAACGEAVCVDCCRERRDALANELEKSNTSEDTGRQSSADTFVFLCVATPECLASATAATRRAGLRTVSDQNNFENYANLEVDYTVDFVTVKALRKSKGFAAVSAVESGYNTSNIGGTPSPVSNDNLRLNTLASPSDFLSIAPACVREGESLQKFLSEAKWGADGLTEGGNAVAPLLRLVWNTSTGAVVRELNLFAERAKEDVGRTREGENNSTGKKRKVSHDGEDDEVPQDDDSDPDSPAYSNAEESDGFLGLLFATTRLPCGIASGDLAADAADASDAARETRRLLERERANSPKSDKSPGPSYGQIEGNEHLEFVDVLQDVMRVGRPLMATTDGSFEGSYDWKRWRNVLGVTGEGKSEGVAMRSRFTSDHLPIDRLDTTTNNPLIQELLTSALRSVPFAAMTHPHGALNVASYGQTEAPVDDNTNGLVPATESFVEADKSITLETCLSPNDVAVSLGVSSLDCIFTTLKSDDSGDEPYGQTVMDTQNQAVRRWHVFARSDRSILSRWLALRGENRNTPCLVFKRLRETRETAAALAAAARAAKAISEVDPTDVSLQKDSEEAITAAEEARLEAEQAARQAYDAASAVSPKQATHALWKRDGFVLSETALEELRRDTGVLPRWIVNQRVGETFFIPAGCPRFATAITPHLSARWFFLSPNSTATSLRLAHQSRFLPTGHKERGDACGVLESVCAASIGMESKTSKNVFPDSLEIGGALDGEKDNSLRFEAGNDTQVHVQGAKRIGNREGEEPIVA